MDLNKSAQQTMRLSVNPHLLIEAVDEGALVFDASSGATTLIGQSALFVIDTVRHNGGIDEADLDATIGTILMDGSKLSSVLASLEKIRLISRC